MHILLINPHDNTYRYRKGAFRRSINYYALTLPTLAALVPAQMQATVQLVDEGVEPLHGMEQADLVAITAVTASAPRAYALADQARALGKTVVMGGPHVTLMPDEALAHADAIATGMAETSWPRLLLDFAAGRLQRVYAQDAAPLDLDAAPPPRRDLLRLHRYLRVPPVLASRGCPNACAFCAIPQLWGRRFHHRSVEAVVAEIRALDTRSVLFLDPAIAEDRHYARALFAALVPLGIRWAGLATLKLTQDEELLDLAQASGCMGLLMGFESLQAGNLAAIGKPFNRPQHYLRAVEALHQRHIRVLGTFMFGLDDDTPEVFAHTARFVDEARIDVVRYAVFTPFPGTPVFAQLAREGRILTRDWSLYDTEHVVFQPRHMSPQELASGLRQAWAHSCALPSIVRRSGLLRPDRMLALAANLGFRFYARRVLA